MTEFQNDARSVTAHASSVHPTAARTAAIRLPRAHMLWFAAMLSVVAAWLLQRSLGLSPAIFADEWFYSKMSRLMPLSEAILPSYLYLWIFSASSACGDSFLDCVRIGNVLLYVGAGPFIYGIARQVCGRWVSMLVVLLSLLAPASSYTAYFMPEATYYAGFAALSWVALTRGHWGQGRHALATGAVLGLMSLVKVHALFLLPSLCLFLVYAAWAAQPRGGWLRAGLAAAAIAAATTFALRLGLGYLLAGENGVRLFGSFYSVAANTAASRSLLDMLPPAFVNARGHLMALALLAALPLANLAHQLISGKARAEAGARRTSLHVYALLMLGGAAGLTIAYTASIAHIGPDEVLRLHLRYYTFVLPLLYIIAAATIGWQPAGPHTPFLWPIALALVAVLAIALAKLPAYSLNPIDSPEVAALDLKLWPGRVAVALNVLVLVLWALRSRLAAPLFLFVLLPMTIAAGIHLTAGFLAQLEQPWATDKAGKFAHAYVPAAERKSITVATHDIEKIMRVQFHIDDPDSGMLQLAPDAPIEPYQALIRNKWLLVVGRHALPSGLVPEVATEDYALVRLKPQHRPIGRALLSQPFDQGIIAATEGLSHAEPWGRWSDARLVVLHLRQPLPQRATIILKAQAFADNTNLPFKMRVGSHDREFRLGGLPQEIGLPFITDGTQKTVVIEVPHPISPADLGTPNDTRKLGIGIAELEIGYTVPHVPIGIHQVPR